MAHDIEALGLFATGEFTRLFGDIEEGGLYIDINFSETNYSVRSEVINDSII